jgi:hypothetical protein
MQPTIHDLNEKPNVMELEIVKLKLNHKWSEITSLEEINDDGEDTKWVRVQNIRRKGNSPK